MVLQFSWDAKVRFFSVIFLFRAIERI